MAGWVRGIDYGYSRVPPRSPASSTRTLVEPDRSELANEADLGLQPVAELRLDGRLCDPDQLADIRGRRMPEVQHDVRVHVGDLGVAVPEALQPALINEAAGADSLDLLEDRSCAGVKLQPRVPAPAPAQILLHDALHDVHVAALETKGHREGNIASPVQHARIVAEAHVLAVHHPTLALLRQDLRGLEHFLNEHRALAIRGRREEMKILPDGTTGRARDADVVLDSRPTTMDGFLDQLRDDSPALDPEEPIGLEAKVSGRVPDDEAAKAAVPDKNVGAEAKHEVGNSERACCRHGIREIIGSPGVEHHVRGTADPERGVLSYRLGGAKPGRVKARR